MMSRWLPEIRSRLASARLEPAREAEIAQELAAHLDDRYAEARRAGLSDAEASRAALDELDQDALMRQQLSALEPRAIESAAVLGDPIRRSPVADVVQDARYAVRMLRANPAFAALAIVTLALGIGATTIVYAIVDTVLVRPLPYPQPDRLVRLTVASPRRPSGGIAPSYPNFMDWRTLSRSFDALGLWYSGPGFVLMEGPEPQRLPSMAVSPDFFETIGYEPALGRSFTEADRQAGAPRVIVLSDGAWRRRFGGDPNIIGHPVQALDGVHQVVGVLPPTFAYSRETDVFLPTRVTPTMQGRGNGMYLVYGRLKPGVAIAQAQLEMDGIARALAAEYPETNKDAGIVVEPFQAQAARFLMPTVRLLAAAAGCILLIGCLNVGGLLVARGVGRSREIAVRTSLGAGRWRILRQLSTESVIVALLGGGLGALVAWWGISAIIPLLPVRMPGDTPVSVDARVLAATLVASAATGLLCGLVPAFHLSRASLTDLMKDGVRGSTAWGRRLGAVLVLVEIALSLVLLTGAGLMIRTLSALDQVPRGFDTAHAVALTASPLVPPNAPPERRDAFYRALVANVASVPGVRAASAIDTLPFWSTSYSHVTIDRSGASVSISPRWIAAGYFTAMGIPMIAGRDFGASDTSGAPCVVIVNQRASSQMWSGEPPLGREMQFPNDRTWCRVVGVVGDVRHDGPMREVLNEVYRPALQKPGVSLTVVARVDDPVAAAASLIAQASRGPERTLPARVQTFETMRELYTDDAKHRALLIGAVSAIGLLLAAIGVFGLTSYSVAQRTREIGVRVALGASRGRIIWTIGGGLAPFVAAGIAAGLIGAWAATRTISTFLFGVTPTDAVTFAAVPIVLGLVATVACLIPARRALRVDPVSALRAE
jgi:putative ABC transport system permease protein